MVKPRLPITYGRQCNRMLRAGWHASPAGSRIGPR